VVRTLEGKMTASFRTAVRSDLYRRAREVALSAADHTPLLGASLSFSNFETRRNQMFAHLASCGVSAEDAVRVMAEAFEETAPREVVQDGAGLYRVTRSEFATTDRVLAEAVAREYDRIDGDGRRRRYGSEPSGIITVPPTMTDEQVERFKEAFVSAETAARFAYPSAGWEVHRAEPGRHGWFRRHP
jgi:hypothetical protein